MNREMLSSAKLQFYPTDEYETWRILGILGDLRIDVRKEGTYRDLLTSFMSEGKNLSIENYKIMDYARTSLYYYLLEKEKYQEIEQLFSVDFPVSRIAGMGEPQPVIISDLFAGKGKWLSLFKQMASDKSSVYLIANELEKNRYSVIESDLNIDECSNQAFEDYQMPKHVVNIMLFHPPYTTIGGQRSAVLYLKMIIERQLMITSKYLEKSYMALILQEDDLEKCVPLLTRNFEIIACYRAANQTHKQFVCIATTRQNPLSESISDAAKHISAMEHLTEMIKRNNEFSIVTALETYPRFEQVDYKKAKSDLEYSMNEVRVESNPDDKPWQFLREITSFRDETKLDIVMPRPPKIGEIANLLAAGQLNSVIETPYGSANHVVIGGSKIRETVLHQEYERKGETEDSVIIIKKHEPYLNILVVNQEGAPQIIELTEQNSEDKPDEPEE